MSERGVPLPPPVPGKRVSSGELVTVGDGPENELREREVGGRVQRGGFGLLCPSSWLSWVCDHTPSGRGRMGCVDKWLDRDC